MDDLHFDPTPGGCRMLAILIVLCVLSLAVIICPMALYALLNIL